MLDKAAIIAYSDKNIKLVSYSKANHEVVEMVKSIIDKGTLAYLLR